ncbi:MAG: hypothetical protein HKN79_08855 [Flavobacteriales bacterium]|nr:hypothetical protein [Flavobacteriales bacterium]
MNRIQILTYCLIFWAMAAHSQILPPATKWIHTDTILDERVLLDRSALLILDLDLQSSTLYPIIEELKTMNKEFPWLNIIGRHQSKGWTVEELKDWSRLQAFEFPLAIVETSASDRTGTLSLYDPSGEARLNSKRYSPSTMEDIRAALQDIASEHGRPGKVLSPSSLYSEKPVLEEYGLLDRPHGIAWDNVYDRFFISDTGNDRIVVIKDDGEVFMTVGSGGKGDALGSFDKAEFDHPLGIAVLRDSSQCFVADHGNARVVIVDINRMRTREFKVKDESGFRLDFPSAPSDLTINDQILSVTLPASQRVWTVDIRTGLLLQEYGIGSGDSFAHKKRKKTVIGEPQASIYSEGYQIIYDGESDDLLSMDLKKVRLLSTKDPDRAAKFKSGVDSTLQFPQVIREHDDAYYVVDAYAPHVFEFDTYSGEIFPVHWMKDTTSVGYITDVCWDQDAMYLLDKKNGIIHRSENGVHSHIVLSKLTRLASGPFRTDDLIMIEPIQLHPDEQTHLEIEFILPEGFVFHPSERSDIFPSAGAELYLEDNGLADGSISLYLLPDYTRNQANLMGVIFLQKSLEPWNQYRRTIQISIPVRKSEEQVEKENYFLIDLLEDFSTSDSAPR